MYTVIEAFTRARNFLFDLVLPRDATIAYIERMTPSAFLKHTTRCTEELPPDTCSQFKYRSGVMRTALWALKYKGNTTIAKLLATCLYDELRDTLLEERVFKNFTDPILIPIPLSQNKLNTRGWNQTAMLARELEKLDQNPTFSVSLHILKKIKDTESQTKLPKSKRIENVKDSFAVSQKQIHEIKDRNIILLDDIYTTGATTNEAKNTLLAAGAKRVIVVTVAH